VDRRPARRRRCSGRPSVGRPREYRSSLRRSVGHPRECRSSLRSSVGRPLECRSSLRRSAGRRPLPHLGLLRSVGHQGWRLSRRSLQRCHSVPRSAALLRQCQLNPLQSAGAHLPLLRHHRSVGRRGQCLRQHPQVG
jgi:hypothetical protein